MILASLSPGMSATTETNARTSRDRHLGRVAYTCAMAALLTTAAASAQVITIDTSGKTKPTSNAPVDRRYAQIAPTKIPLPTAKLDEKSRIELIRVLQSEQGFAMRPFPRGHKGLTLVANGKLEPAGEAYLNMVINNGTSAKPGDRLVVSDVKIEDAKIILELNGGPDFKHRFLRHISIGMGGPDMDSPVVQDDGEEVVGARLTLAFDGSIPQVTGAQVKALLAPLISFDVKTPVQAFTDTLPTPLKDAILNHQVMVGMSTDMVLFAKGQPQTKSREIEGQTPFEEWIYGKPPQEVDFVRINGNRVIRVEIAKVGEPLAIFTQDVVSGLLIVDGSPVMTAETHTRVVREGDVERDPNKEESAAPPSLRNPGEKLPQDPNVVQSTSQKDVGVMKPVQFPKPNPDTQPGANPDSVPDSQPDASTTQSSPPTSSPAPVKTPSPAAGTDQPN